LKIIGNTNIGNIDNNDNCSGAALDAVLVFAIWLVFYINIDGLVKSRKWQNRY